MYGFNFFRAVAFRMRIRAELQVMNPSVGIESTSKITLVISSFEFLEDRQVFEITVTDIHGLSNSGDDKSWKLIFEVGPEPTQPMGRYNKDIHSWSLISEEFSV